MHEHWVMFIGTWDETVVHGDDFWTVVVRNLIYIYKHHGLGRDY